MSARSLMWITNVPMQYRWGIWRELSKIASISVLCLAEPRFGRTPLSRIDDIGNATLSVAYSRRFQYKDYGYYLPNIRLWLLLRSNRPSVVYVDGWESPAYWFAIAWARVNRIPVLIGYRSTLESGSSKSGLVQLIRCRVLRTASAVVVAGVSSRRATLAAGVDPHKIFFMKNSVDVDTIEEEARELRKVRPIPEGGVGHRFLFIGQLIERKNVSSLLTAMAQQRNQNDSLVVLGAGPMRRELEEETLALGLGGRVTFEGHVDRDRILEQLAESNTLVLPSTSEVWGLVVNEALSAGLHVVVSARAGVTDRVRAMRGVYVARPIPNDLSLQMSKSSDEWQGWIEDPEILQDGHSKLAADLWSMCEIVYERRTR